MLAAVPQGGGHLPLTRPLVGVGPATSAVFPAAGPRSLGVRSGGAGAYGDRSRVSTDAAGAFSHTLPMDALSVSQSAAVVSHPSPKSPYGP